MSAAPGMPTITKHGHSDDDTASDDDRYSLQPVLSQVSADGPVLTRCQSPMLNSAAPPQSPMTGTADRTVYPPDTPETLTYDNDEDRTVDDHAVLQSNGAQGLGVNNLKPESNNPGLTRAVRRQSIASSPRWSELSLSGADDDDVTQVAGASRFGHVPMRPQCAQDVSRRDYT